MSSLICSICGIPSINSIQGCSHYLPKNNGTYRTEIVNSTNEINIVIQKFKYKIKKWSKNQNVIKWEFYET